MMFKSLFLLAIVFGMCTCAPLLDSAIQLESVLLIPQTEMLTNSSVVMEQMPEMEKLVKDMPETVEETVLEKNFTTLESLKEKDTILLEEMDQFEKDIKSETKILEDNELEIMEKIKEFIQIKETEILGTKKASQILDEVREELTVDQSLVLDDMHVNETVKLALESEFLPLDNRTELVMTHMNETEKVVVLAEELELIKLDKEMIEMAEKTKKLAADMADRKKVDEKLKELIMMKEAKVLQMLDLSETIEGEIVETESEMKTEVKEMFGSNEKDSSESSEEKDELMVHREEKEEMKVDMEEKYKKRSYTAFRMETPQMIEVPVTTESYHEEVPQMIVVPVTAEAPQMIELPVTTEAPQMIEAPVTTEAYHKVASPMIEEPATTVGYQKRQMDMDESKEVEEEKGSEEKSESSESSEESEETEEPEFKDRQVRDILDKITFYFQLKNQGILDFVSTGYCSTDKTAFQFYKIHPTDTAKYVECDPWGKGTIKSCMEGKLWDQFHEMCSTPQFLNLSKNLTAEFEKSEKLEEHYSGLNCNNSDYKCVNEGECITFEDGYMCECTKEFTGEFCEYKVVENSIFTEILTDTFNFTEFRDELTAEEMAKQANMITAEEMDNMKTLLKDSTHSEIMTYLDLNNTHKQIRYDIIMNALTEAILEDIYPDAYYMSAFNVSFHRLVDVVRTIPSLISYSKYENERYSEVFAKYQEVLGKAVETLNETWTGVDMEAIEYIKITSHILNETGVMDSVFDSASKMSQKEVANHLEMVFNKTTEQTMQNTLELTGLRRSLIKEMVKRPEIINMRLSELVDECKIVEKLVEIFDGIQRDSTEVINSLFSYGFWYATDSLAGRF